MRWQSLHCMPHGPKKEKRVRRQRKQTRRFSTSSLTRTSMGSPSSSALVMTERMCTISARVTDRRSSPRSIQVCLSMKDLFHGPSEDVECVDDVASPKFCSADCSGDCCGGFTGCEERENEKLNRLVTRTLLTHTIYVTYLLDVIRRLTRLGTRGWHRVCLIQVTLTANNGVATWGGASRFALCGKVVGCVYKREREDHMDGASLVAILFMWQSTLRMHLMYVYSICCVRLTSLKGVKQSIAITITRHSQSFTASQAGREDDTREGSNNDVYRQLYVYDSVKKL